MLKDTESTSTNHCEESAWADDPAISVTLLSIVGLVRNLPVHRFLFAGDLYFDILEIAWNLFSWGGDKTLFTYSFQQSTIC